MAALYHDAGKPETAWRGADGHLHYYANDEAGTPSHEEAGARLTRREFRRMGFGNRLTEHVRHLVDHHMWASYQNPTPARARKFIARHGLKRARWLVELKRADMLGKGGPTKLPAGVEQFGFLIDSNASAATSIRDLEINGDDLLELGLEGRAVGETLKSLLGQVVGSPELNNREWLLRNAA